ncbi:MAG: hypothetical protein HZA52_11740 [Planctomycetes bacterium]|nr:hypothetical protein [Planctomycetota bacterium]
MSDRFEAACAAESRGPRSTSLWFVGLALAAFVVAGFVGLATPERQFATFVLLGLGVALLLALFAWRVAGSASTPGGTWFVRCYFAAFALTTLALLYSASVPGFDFGVLFVALPTYALLLAIWLSAALAVLARRVFLQGFRAALAGHAVAWTVPPLVVLALAIAVLLQLPLRMRFALGRAELDALVERARVEPLLVTAEIAAWDTNEFHFVGTYPTRRIELFDGGVRVLVSSSGFLDGQGFAYCDRGAPPQLGEDFYDPFWGDWYLWRASW